MVGQLLVTSHNKIYGYLTFDGKRVTLSGLFNLQKFTMTLQGTDSAREKVKVQLTQ